MTQIDMFTLPDNPFPRETQAHRVYSWLQEYKQVYLSELHHVLKVDTARVRVDVKRFLRQNGYEIECIRIREGETLYKVRP